MSNQSPVSVEQVSDEELKEHFTGNWVELKIKNWKEEGCIVLAHVGEEKRGKIWNEIQPIVSGRYGEKSVHPSEVQGWQFVVINIKDYNDGRTPLGQQILLKTRDIDLEFLKEPAVLDAIIDTKEKWKEWFHL